MVLRVLLQKKNIYEGFALFGASLALVPNDFALTVFENGFVGLAMENQTWIFGDKILLGLGTFFHVQFEAALSVQIQLAFMLFVGTNL